MGYFVSPSGGDVSGVSSSVNAQMNLGGKYVNTGSHSVSRTVSNVEVVDLSLNKSRADSLKNTSYNFLASIEGTGAEKVGGFRNTSFEGDSTLDFNKYIRAQHTEAERINAFCAAANWGIIDIWEGLFDGLIGIFRPDLAAIDISGDKLKEIEDTGIDLKSAYKVGQTMGRIGMCIAVIAIAGLILSAPVSVPVAAACCFCVGAVVGIGLGIEKGYQDMRLIFNSISEGLNFASIGAGIAKSIATLATLKGSLVENLAIKIRKLPTIITETFNNLLRDPVDWFLKTLLDIDLDNLLYNTAEHAEAVVNLWTKFFKDFTDIFIAFYFDGNGMEVLKNWAIGKPFSLANDLLGKTSIISVFSAGLKAKAQGKKDDYAILNAFISKFLAILSFVFKPA